MKNSSKVICIVCLACLVACKKSNDGTPTLYHEPPFTLNQSIVYKMVATVASPADSAAGRLRDSVSAYRNVEKTDPTYYSNIPNVYANIMTNFTGFGLIYQDPNKPFPYFDFNNYAFP